MKRKTFAEFGLVIILIVGFIAYSIFGNKQLIDLNNKFEYAIILLPNGKIKEGPISKWKDYDGEQLQVIFKDGEVHLTTSARCELINY